MQQAIQVGDEIRGKDSLLRGRVLKILDAGYLMIYESEFEMEMNIHESEIIKVEPLDLSSKPPKQEIIKADKTAKRISIDLHLEKLPNNYRNEGSLFGQISYCEYKLALAIQEGVQSVEIIHGKGSGKLHTELMKKLKQNSRVRSIEIKKAALELPHAIIVFLV